MESFENLLTGSDKALGHLCPGQSKGPVFEKGHQVKSEDLCRLMRMGKNNLYVLDLNENQVHEDDAVYELASALSGPGVIFSGSPREGKLELKAAYPGLLKVNVDALVEFNMVDDVMCASSHNNTSKTANPADFLPAPLENPVRHLGHMRGKMDFRKNQEIMFDKINCKSYPKLYI